MDAQKELIEQVRQLAKKQKKASAYPWHRYCSSIYSAKNLPVLRSTELAGGNCDNNLDFAAAAGSLDFTALLSALSAAAPSVGGETPAGLVLPAELRKQLEREAARIVSDEDAEAMRNCGLHGDFDGGAAQGRAHLAAEILAAAGSAVPLVETAAAEEEFDACADECHKCGSVEWTYKDTDGCNNCPQYGPKPDAAASPLPVVVTEAAAGWVKCDGKSDYQAEEDYVWVLQAGKVESGKWAEAYMADESLWLEEQLVRAGRPAEIIKVPPFMWLEYVDEGTLGIMDPQPTHFQPKPSAPGTVPTDKDSR